MEKVHLVYRGSLVIRNATMELTRVEDWQKHRIADVPRWKAKIYDFDLSILGYETIFFVVRATDRSVAKFLKTDVEPGIVYATGCEEFDPIVDDDHNDVVHPFSFVFH